MYKKIKHKLKGSWGGQTIIAITLACLLINTFAGMLYFKNEEVNNSKNWVIHSYEVLRQTRLVLVNVQDMEIGQRGYFLSNRDEFLKTYEKASQSVVIESDKLNKLILDNPDQLARALNFQIDLKEHESLLDEQIKRFSHNMRAITVRDLQESSALLDTIRNKISKFQAEEREILNQRQIVEKRKRKEYSRLIIFGSLLSVIGLIAANSFVYYQTLRRKNAEAELRHSEELYAFVTQGINEGIYEYDIKNGKIFYSEGFKKMLGYNNDEFPSTVENLKENIHPEDFKYTWEAINNFTESKDILYRNIFRMRHKDGTYIWIMSRGVGVRDKNGKLIKLIGTHTDITEQKEKEEYLKRLNTDLENFTYITSHDLRSPLVNLKGFAGEISFSLTELNELFKKALPKANKHYKAIENILEVDLPESIGYIKGSVDRLDQLTSAILDLSRIGKREIKMEVINIEEVAKRILSTMAYEINNAKIGVKLGNLPEIVSDRISIQQIFSNIIENGIKYLDEKKTGEISITGTVFPSEVQFIIADNGRGISEGDHERVFDMFKRTRNVKEVRGNGMGLAFVKATIQRLGGKIWVESTLGAGSKFIFTIPNQGNKGVLYHEQ